MEFGLKPLGREKFWMWALLTPTLWPFLQRLWCPAGNRGAQFYQMGSIHTSQLGGFE